MNKSRLPRKSRFCYHVCKKRCVTVDRASAQRLHEPHHGADPAVIHPVLYRRITAGCCMKLTHDEIYEILTACK